MHFALGHNNRLAPRKMYILNHKKTSFERITSTEWTNCCQPHNQSSSNRHSVGSFCTPLRQYMCMPVKKVVSFGCFPFYKPSSLELVRRYIGVNIASTCTGVCERASPHLGFASTCTAATSKFVLTNLIWRLSLNFVQFQNDSK